MCEMCVAHKGLYVSEGGRKGIDAIEFPLLCQWWGSLRLLASVKADCG